MSLSRRTLIRASVASAALVNLGSKAEAQTYPTQSFQSVNSNFSPRFIRHKNFRVLLEPVTYSSSELDQFDATFVIKTGLNPTTGVSFMARNENLRDYYLRHQDFKLLLHKLPPAGAPDRGQFEKDATWFVAPGRTEMNNPTPNNDRKSFYSPQPQFQGRFIRHRNFELFFDVINPANPTDVQDATFTMVRPGFKPY